MRSMLDTHETPAALRELTPSAKRVYSVLASHAGELLTYKQIADEAGCSKITAKRAAVALEGRGLLSRIKGVASQRGRAGTIYLLTTPMSTRDVYTAPEMSTRDESEDLGLNTAVSTREEQAASADEHSAPIYIGGTSTSQVENAMDVSVLSGEMSAPTEEPTIRESVSSPASSIASSDFDGLTPQDLANVAAIERRLESLVTTEEGRRDLAVAIRYAEVQVGREVDRLSQSPTARSRSGVLIDKIRKGGWNVSPFVEQGRCTSCGAALDEPRWCVVCALAVHPPILADAAPLSEAERADIARLEAERGEQIEWEAEQFRLVRQERVEWKRREVYLRSPPQGEFSARDIADAARREVHR
jgi:hypothetical protein